LRSIVSLLVVALVLSLSKPAAAQGVVVGRPARVRFVASDPDVSFLLPGASASGGGSAGRINFAWRHQEYTPLCNAPCERVMLEDTYRFALTLRGGLEVHAPMALVLRDGAVVHGHYVDNGLTRTLGHWLLGLSGLATAGLAIVGGLEYGRERNLERALPWWAGAGGAFVGLCVGLGMSWVWDQAEVRFVSPSLP
jgi:hypothetical protein